MEPIIMLINLIKEYKFQIKQFEVDKFDELLYYEDYIKETLSKFSKESSIELINSISDSFKYFDMSLRTDEEFYRNYIKNLIIYEDKDEIYKDNIEVFKINNNLSDIFYQKFKIKLNF